MERTRDCPWSGERANFGQTWWSLCQGPLSHKVTSEVCQDSEGESRNVQKFQTEHVAQKCKGADEPEKQVVFDDDYDVSDKFQNSQTGTMESDAVHVKETQSIMQSREVDNNMQIALNRCLNRCWCFLELIRKSSLWWR